MNTITIYLDELTAAELAALAMSKSLGIVERNSAYDAGVALVGKSMFNRMTAVILNAMNEVSSMD